MYILKCRQKTKNELPHIIRKHLVGEPNNWVQNRGEYVLVTTTETDEMGFFKEPGKINGGFFMNTQPRTALPYSESQRKITREARDDASMQAS